MPSPRLDSAVVRELDRLMVERERGAITESEHRRRVDELIRGTRRGWRGIPEAMVIWTLLFALVLLTAVVFVVTCTDESPAVCSAPLLAAMMFGMVWLIGLLVLAIWQATKPKRGRNR